MDLDMMDKCELARYLVDELYKSAKSERKPLEDKWERNRQAFMKISNGSNSGGKSGEAEGWRSDTFIGVVKTKVTAAYALIIDHLLSHGEIPFEMVLNSWQNELLDDMPDDVQEQVKEDMREAEKLIRKQLADCNADRSMMSAAMSAALLGRTYSKNKVIDLVRRGYAQSSESGMWERTKELVKSPAVYYVSCWNMFHDWEVDNLQDGWGLFHRDYLDPYDLRKKGKESFFLEDRIKKVIEKVKDGDNLEDGEETLAPEDREKGKRKRTIRYLEFWGRAPKKYVESFEKELERSDTEVPVLLDRDELESDGDEVEIHCVIANDMIVRYARVEENERPFNMCDWEKVVDESLPIGVADNLEHVQKSMNWAVRAFEDNKKLSGNVMAAVKKRLLAKKTNLKWKPGESIEVTEECDDARKAIQPIVVPDVGESLMSLIHMTSTLQDIESQIPKIAQGLSTEAEKTAYETSQQINSSGKYIGAILMNFDEGWIEPNVRWFFDYNMEDPDIEKGKGNFVPKAKGYTSYQERVLRIGKLQQILQLLMSDEKLSSRYDLAEICDDIIQALDYDADKYRISQEELQQNAEAAQQAEENDPIRLLEIEAKKSAIAKNQADVKRAEAEAEAVITRAEADQARAVALIDESEEKLKIERAKLVHLASRGHKVKDEEPVEDWLTQQ